MKKAPIKKCINVEEFNSEIYRTKKYLKAIVSLSIFNLFFLITSIVGIIKWWIIDNFSHTCKTNFILFIVSLVLFIITWFVCGAISIFCIIRHFKPNIDYYPNWVIITSYLMILIPSIPSFIIFGWESKLNLNK